jgi:hypothetical protein
MAGTTGLEPATSAVTGQRSNQLSYVPTAVVLHSKCNILHSFLAVSLGKISTGQTETLGPAESTADPHRRLAPRIVPDFLWNLPRIPLQEDMRSIFPTRNI